MLAIDIAHNEHIETIWAEKEEEEGTTRLDAQQLNKNLLSLKRADGHFII